MQAGKNRPADDGVTDVELADAGDSGDGPDVVVIKPVSGIDQQTDLDTVCHCRGDRRQLLRFRLGAARVRIVAGVDLYGRRADLACRIDLPRIGIDK